MSMQLLIEAAIVLVVAIVALPLVGQALAMVLGVWVTLRGRGVVAAGRDEGRSRPSAVESRLRRTVMALGSRLDVDETPGFGGQRGSTEARTIPERRYGERRIRARRWHARKVSGRRDRERRDRERRDRERRDRERRAHGQRRRN